jgi:guanine deaminase
VYLHTHLAENEEEVAQVARQFPWSRSYLDVYEHFGLVRERSVFAHCIHMGDDDRKLMARKGAAMAFCPSSNLFLGSGLFDLSAARQCGICVGAGSDVGGGTSLSMLRTLGDGYKVLQLNKQALAPFDGLYLATLGAARALYLDNAIGNFVEGNDADFVALDESRTTIVQRQWGSQADIAAKLFTTFNIDSDGCVAGSFVKGEQKRRQ